MLDHSQYNSLFGCNKTFMFCFIHSFNAADVGFQRSIGSVRYGGPCALEVSSDEDDHALIRVLEFEVDGPGKKGRMVMFWNSRWRREDELCGCGWIEEVNMLR